MVAKVLIFDNSKLNVSSIASKLRGLYCSVLFARSVENTFKIMGTRSIDIVLVPLPLRFSRSFMDFFSILRQLCGVIPIVGIIESEKQVIPELSLEDIFFTNIEQSDLINRLSVLMKMKNMFNETLLNRMSMDECSPQKVITFFHDDVDFLHESFLKKIEIIKMKNFSVTDNFDDSDLFIININHRSANECCANLRLKYRYKPIVFTFNKSSKKKLKRAQDLNIGFTDVIDSESNPIINKCRLSFLIKYKKLYDIFSLKLEKSLYLSTIDSTTEVYSRSFFEDYLRNKDFTLSNTAIIMVDVDKFKLINDKFGHTFADSVLKHVTNTIKSHTRSSDIIARYGGDEFIIIMNNVVPATAGNIARRIQKKISESPFQNAHCTVSVGVCCVESGEKISIHDAISVADKFMYISKQNGGNAVSVCV